MLPMMTLPALDEHFSKYAKVNHYQRRPLLLGLSFVKSWKRAVDVGAHVGFLARDMMPFFEQVVCFEPARGNCDCLVKNVPGAVVYNVALGDHAGRTALRNPEPTNSGAWELTKGQDLPMDTLDSFQLDDVGFIKIDVQGSEVAVLEGARQTLAQHPVIMIELRTNGEVNQSAADLLADLGATEMCRLGKDSIFVWNE